MYTKSIIMGKLFSEKAQKNATLIRVFFVNCYVMLPRIINTLDFTYVSPCVSVAIDVQ